MDAKTFGTAAGERTCIGCALTKPGAKPEKPITTATNVNRQASKAQQNERKKAKKGLISIQKQHQKEAAKRYRAKADKNTSKDDKSNRRKQSETPQDMAIPAGHYYY